MVKNVTLTQQTEVSFYGDRCRIDGNVGVRLIKVPSRSVCNSIRRVNVQQMLNSIVSTKC